MSHELRTPLNAIGGYAELLALGVHGPIAEEQRAALEKIQRSQRHLLGLINGVLNYAKVDAGAVSYNIERFPVDEVLSACEALIAPQVREKQLTFEACPPNPGVECLGDREKVQQVLLNLLTNAIKFTNAGGVIRISCHGMQDRIGISVQDNGRGIPPEQLESIFQPFVQLDAKLTRTQEGVGLGLSISRDLARGMGGDLTVTSTPGEGSTFLLTLPVPN